MTNSINLRHFPERDPESMTARDTQRAEIAEQVKAFLAGGGEITQHEPEDNQARSQPVKRSRKDQINHVKRMAGVPKSIKNRPPNISRQRG